MGRRECSVHSILQSCLSWGIIWNQLHGKKNIRESPRCQFMAFEHSVFHSVPLLCFFIGHQLLEDTLSDRRRKVQHVHTTSKFVARPFFYMSDWHMSTNNKTDHFLWMPLERNHGSFVYNYSAISSPFICFPLHCMQIIDEGKLKGKEERKYAEQKQERKGVAHYYYSTTSWLLR